MLYNPSKVTYTNIVESRTGWFKKSLNNTCLEVIALIAINI